MRYVKTAGAGHCGRRPLGADGSSACGQADYHRRAPRHGCTAPLRLRAEASQPAGGSRPVPANLVGGSRKSAQSPRAKVMAPDPVWWPVRHQGMLITSCAARLRVPSQAIGLGAPSPAAAGRLTGLCFESRELHSGSADHEPSSCVYARWPECLPICASLECCERSAARSVHGRGSTSWRMP
jgi:hypothetical protein